LFEKKFVKYFVQSHVRVFIQPPPGRHVTDQYLVKNNINNQLDATITVY